MASARITKIAVYKSESSTALVTLFVDVNNSDYAFVNSMVYKSGHTAMPTVAPSIVYGG